MDAACCFSGSHSIRRGGVAMHLTPEEREQLWQEYWTKTGRYAEHEPIEEKTEVRPETLTPFDLDKLERTIQKQFITGLIIVVCALYLLSKLLS